MFGDGGFDQLLQRGAKILRLLEGIRKKRQLLGHDGVENDVRPGDGQVGPEHPELEFVAGERKRRGAVAVGGILREPRQDMHPDLHDLLVLLAVRRAGFDRLEDSGEVVAEEHGHDGRRRLIRTEPVIVARARHRHPQQILVFVHSLDNCS